jgi:hypothetical protein
MQVILSGSLRHFPPAALLTFLASRGMSGTLDFETAGRRARVFFQNDRIVWAESNKGGDVVEAALDVFEWPAGTFTLLDSTVLPDGVSAVSLELATLVEEARKRAEAASIYKDGATFRVIDNPSQQQLTISADDLKLLFRLSAPRAFKDLVAELGLPRKDLADRLRKLEETGLVSRDDPDKTDPALKPARKRTLVGSLTPDGATDNVFPLLDAEQTLGRVPTNNITLPDASVSSTHARITRTPEGFFIEDLQSRNGTFVNGEKVEAKRLLADGDLIRLGKVMIRLLADGDLIRLGKVMMTFNVAREGKMGDSTQPEVRVV